MGQGHTVTSIRTEPCNPALLGLVSKCFEACPGLLPSGRQEGSVGMVQSSLVGLSFTGITYLLDRKEVIKCK